MDSKVLDTAANKNRNNDQRLITEPFEEYNNLVMDQDISERGFSINLGRNESPSPKKLSSLNDEVIINTPQLFLPSDNLQDQVYSFPLSPIEKIHGQSLSMHNLDQINFMLTPRNLIIDYPQKPRNIYQNLMKSFFMRTFIRKLSYKQNMNSKFNHYHFNVINDKGSAFKMNQSKVQEQQSTEVLLKKNIIIPLTQCVNHVFDKVNQMIQWIPIIYPESKLKLGWDGLVFIARIYFMFMIPLDLSFGQEQFLFGHNYTLTVTMIILLLLDFMVSLNSAHYEQGLIVKDRVKIAQYTFLKSGGLEVIGLTLLVLTWVIQYYQDDYFIDASVQVYQLGLMLFFVQYRNISKFIRQVEEAFNISKQTRAILELLKLLVGVIVVLHVFACLWYWAGYYSHITYGKSWIATKFYLHKTWQETYLYSFYFSAVTMFTVGYGDISPISDLETIVSIFFMMITSIQLSYSITTVGMIIDKISAYEQEQAKKIHVINTFMISKKIGYKLQHQVREYLNYFWQAQNEEDSQQETKIIGQLSEHLRGRIMLEANTQILNNCVLFRNNFSAELKVKLVQSLRQVVVQPENLIDFDKIFPENEKNQIFLSFIEKGSVQIHIENEANHKNNAINSEVSLVSQINQGQSIGVINFITGGKTSERFRSIGFTKLLLLSREDFLNIIQDFPEDQEQYQYFQDQLKLYQSLKILKMSCFSCKSIYHKALDCPLLHFIPNREFLIKQEQFSRNQERNEQSIKRNQVMFQRKIRRVHLNALSDKDFIQEDAIDFQRDYLLETMFYDCEAEVSDSPQEGQEQFVKLKSEKIITQKEEITQNKPTLEINILAAPQSRKIPNNKGDQIDETLANTDQKMQKISLLKKTDKSVQLISEDIFPNSQESMSPQLSFIKIQKKDSNLNESNSINLQDKKQSIDQKKGQLKLPRQNSTPKILLKQGFQKVFHSIKSNNTKNRLQSSQKSNSLTDQYSLIEIDRRNQLQFQKNQLQCLMNRNNRIIQKINFTNTSLVFQRDIKQVEFTILRLQMLIESKEPLNEFEHAKTFKFYFPENNIDSVLFNEENYYKPNKLNTENLPKIFSRLVQYFLYPFDYIEAFVFIPINKTQSQTTQRGNISSKMNINLQKRMLEKKQRQNSKKLQIRPLSQGEILTSKLKKYQD